MLRGEETTDITHLLKYLSIVHSQPGRVVQQRQALELLRGLHEKGEEGLSRGHLKLCLMAARCCLHADMAFWLLKTLLPPPLSGSARHQAKAAAAHSPSFPSPASGAAPSAAEAVWPREMELGFDTIVQSVEGKSSASPPPSAGRLLGDYLHYLTQHGYRLLPRMLPLCLGYLRHFDRHRDMLRLHQYYRKHRIPIGIGAVPQLLVACRELRLPSRAAQIVEEAESAWDGVAEPQHWYPVYHAAMDAQGACGRLDAALALYQALKDRGLQPTAPTYTAIVRAIAAAAPQSPSPVSTLDTLRSLHEEVLVRQVALTLHLHRALILAYLRLGDQETSARLLHGFISSFTDNSRSAFFVVGVSIEVESCEAALRAVDRVRLRRLQLRGASAAPHVLEQWQLRLPVFNQCLQLLVRHRKWAMMKALWDMRADLEVQPNLYTLQLVSQAVKQQSASWAALLQEVAPTLPVTRLAEAEPPHWWLDASQTDNDRLVTAQTWWTLQAIRTKWGPWTSKRAELQLRVQAKKRYLSSILNALQMLGLRDRGESISDEQGQATATVTLPWPMLQQWREEPLPDVRAQEAAAAAAAAEQAETQQQQSAALSGSDANEADDWNENDENPFVVDSSDTVSDKNDTEI